jgi:hypothetical protein
MEQYPSLEEIANAREASLKQSQCMPPPWGCGRRVIQRVQDIAYVMRSIDDPLVRETLEEIEKQGMPFRNGVTLSRYRASSLCQDCQGRYDIRLTGNDL